MNEQQAKELGEEIRELLPDNTITFKLQANKGTDMYIKYKDSDSKITEIRIQL